MSKVFKWRFAYQTPAGGTAYIKVNCKSVLVVYGHKIRLYRLVDDGLGLWPTLANIRLTRNIPETRTERFWWNSIE